MRMALLRYLKEKESEEKRENSKQTNLFWAYFFNEMFCFFIESKLPKKSTVGFQEPIPVPYRLNVNGTHPRLHVQLHP